MSTGCEGQERNGVNRSNGEASYELVRLPSMRLTLDGVQRRLGLCHDRVSRFCCRSRLDHVPQAAWNRCGLLTSPAPPRHHRCMGRVRSLIPCISILTSETTALPHRPLQLPLCAQLLGDFARNVRHLQPQLDPFFVSARALDPRMPTRLFRRLVWPPVR